MSPSILHYFKRKKSPSPPPSSRPLRPPPQQQQQQQQPPRPAASTAAQATPQAPQGSPVHIPSLARSTFSPSPSPSPSQDDKQESVPKQDKGKGKEKEQQGTSSQPLADIHVELEPEPKYQKRMREDEAHVKKLIAQFPEDPNDPIYQTDEFTRAMDDVLTHMHRDSQTQCLRDYVIAGTHYLLDPIRRKATIHILKDYFRKHERTFFIDAYGNIFLRDRAQPVDISVLNRCGEESGRLVYLGHGGMSNEAGENAFFVNLAKQAKKDMDSGKDSFKSRPFVNCEKKDEVARLLKKKKWLRAAQVAGIKLWYAGVANGKQGWWHRWGTYEKSKFDPSESQFVQKRAFGHPASPNPAGTDILDSSFDYFEFAGPLQAADHESIPVLLETLAATVTRSMSHQSEHTRTIQAELDLPRVDMDYAHIGTNFLHPLIPSWRWNKCRDYLLEFCKEIKTMQTAKGAPIMVCRDRPERLTCRINMPAATDNTGIDACGVRVPVLFCSTILNIRSISDPLENVFLQAHLVFDVDNVGLSFSFKGTRFTINQIFKRASAREHLELWYWQLLLALAVGTLTGASDDDLKKIVDEKIGNLAERKATRKSSPTCDTDDQIDGQVLPGGDGFPATIAVSQTNEKGLRFTVRVKESARYEIRRYDEGIINIILGNAHKALLNVLEKTEVTINGQRQSVLRALTGGKNQKIAIDCFIRLTHSGTLKIVIPDFNDFEIPWSIIPKTAPFGRFCRRVELIVREVASEEGKDGADIFVADNEGYTSDDERKDYTNYSRKKKGRVPAAPVTSSSTVAVPSTSSSTAVAVASTSRVKKSVNKITSFFKKQASSSTAPSPPTTSSSGSQPVASAAPVASSSAPAQTSSLSVATPPSIATPSSSNPTVPLPSTSTLTSKLERFRFKGKEIDPSVRGKFGGI